MSGWTKLFSSIVTSSVWCEDDTTLRVWIALLATADQNGVAEGALPGLASLCRLSVEATERVLKRLTSPDPYSRTPDFDGRRIEPVDGGWLILNYQKYREKRDPDVRRRQVREAVARLRARRRSGKPEVSLSKPPKAQAEAEAEAEKKQKRINGLSPSPTTIRPDDSDPGVTATAYVAVLDAVFGRRTKKVADDVLDGVRKRMQAWRAWQIVATPILVKAQNKWTLPDTPSPDIFLRDGKHQRTVNGTTSGARYWIARTFDGHLDGLRLSADLFSIAKQAHVWERLAELGVTCDEPQETASGPDQRIPVAARRDG